MVIQRPDISIVHRRFPDLLDCIRPGDVLVFNNSKVIQARLRGKNRRTGGQFEILLIEENSANDWWAMLRPGKRAPVDTQIELVGNDGMITPWHASVVDINSEGHRRLRFEGGPDLTNALLTLGEIPLPPYIKRADSANLPEDLERYQTVYAQPSGSIAAPTAGLHFTPQLLDKIVARKAEVRFVTLHVGIGTFSPVKTETLDEHVMHEERYQVNPETARAVSAAKRDGRRVIAVGTTSLRVLESAAALDGSISAGEGRTRIFIHPPHHFRVVDALLTNFHLPRSTLLMLVSAFAAPGETSGREAILHAYAEAVRERYRFFSYGDAMLIQ